MNTNPVSYRAKQQNLLKSKTQTFLHNYSQSRNRIQSRSSMHNLAGTIYSSHQNRQMSPQKHANRSVVFPLIKFQNPEVADSPAMKGLNMRASHIANYSDINTELLLERKNLEQRIAFLKEQMAKEKKLLARSDLNGKKASNDIERAEKSIKELNVKSERLNDGISEARQDRNQFKMTLNNLRIDNVNANNSISNEQNNCANLEAKCKTLKNGLLIEEKNKTTLKGELIKQQKVMTSCSILTKELQHERAVLLLQINKSVALNKLS